MTAKSQTLHFRPIQNSKLRIQNYVSVLQKFKESVIYYAKGLWDGLDRDHCFLFASGIAFNVLLCIIPLSLILFQIFSIILQNNESAKLAVLQYIQDGLPIEQYGKSVH